MARFDIYANPIAADRHDFPFMLEIQSDLLYRFAERVCMPLVRSASIPGLTERFNPTIDMDVAGDPVRLHPLGISVFHAQELGLRVASAQAQALDIDTAIDMLLRGY